MLGDKAKREKPSYRELSQLVKSQRKALVELHGIIEEQEAVIARLRGDVRSIPRLRPGDGVNRGATTHGLGARVEAILRLAEDEAEALREQARQESAELVAAAEQEAARIRAEATRASAPSPESSPESLPESWTNPQIKGWNGDEP